MQNPRNIVDEKLNNLISKYQIHNWLREKWNIKKNGAVVNYCINGYPFDSNDNDRIDSSGRVYYKRRIGDEFVVTYNPELLMLVKWHTNVQIVTSDTVAVYISKYITKINKNSIPDTDRWKTDEVEKEDFSEVEKYFKERKIGLLEAWNDLLSLHHYKNTPSINNFYITTPSERIWKIIPTKDIKLLIEQKKQNGNQEDIDDGFLLPSAWEIYMWMSEELENITFPQMLTKYQWWSRFDLIPQHSKKDGNSQALNWKQQPYKKFYEIIKEKSMVSTGNATIDEILASQLNISFNRNGIKLRIATKEEPISY